MSETAIRAYQPSDREALSLICVKTGHAGSDATGRFVQDTLLGDIFAVPYAEFDASLVFVLERDGEAVGYVLGTADTETFDAWFHNTWWPATAPQYAADADTTLDAGVLSYAASIGSSPVPYATEYPAHLHIDLLPAAQGGGWGRKLIETFIAALRERGVPGVHLVASGENTNAIAFYERLGFTRLASEDGAAAFGMRL